MTFQASSKLGAVGSLSHGIYYGSSIAVIIHSFDHSLFGRLIIRYGICYGRSIRIYYRTGFAIALTIRSVDRYPLA